MKIPMQDACRSNASLLLNRFTNIVHYFLGSLLEAGIFSYPNKLALLGSAGGAAGTGILDFLQVANDLGSAFLDGLAIGTHHKAA